MKDPNMKRSSASMNPERLATYRAFARSVFVASILGAALSGCGTATATSDSADPYESQSPPGTPFQERLFERQRP